MVNNGASGACHACKQKRKKCDETRPSCLRCNRARRNCPGYEPRRERKFINYSGKADFSFLPQRPADLPHRMAGSTHLSMPEWPAIEQNARFAFFNDYCIVSSNRDLSRGYLHGLQTMLVKAGPSSELAQACTIIALANIGKRFGNATYINRAKGLYTLLLRSFRLSISNEATFTTVESLITAALLGLYEVVISSDLHPSAHVAHAQGVSAILISEFSPFDLICGGRLFQVANPILLKDLEVENSKSPALQHSSSVIKMPLQHSASVTNKMTQRFSVLCSPLSSQPNPTIDLIYSQTMSLLRRAETLLGSEATLDQLLHLKLEAEQLKEAYNAWPETVPQEWIPKSAGFIISKDDEIIPSIGYWPGTISCYYDLYVASLWNNYRKAYLLVLHVIIRCRSQLSSHLISPDIDSLTQEDITRFTEEIVSSIPYLLAADLQAFVENATEQLPLVPGRPVGGLLSIYSLYILLTLPMVEAKLKIYIRDCLAWIGTRMGIGQATILSKCTTMDRFNFATEARVIIWTGMLI